MESPIDLHRVSLDNIVPIASSNVYFYELLTNVGAEDFPTCRPAGGLGAREAQELLPLLPPYLQIMYKKVKRIFLLFCFLPLRPSSSCSKQTCFYFAFLFAAAASYADDEESMATSASICFSLIPCCQETPLEKTSHLLPSSSFHLLASSAFPISPSGTLPFPSPSPWILQTHTYRRRLLTQDCRSSQIMDRWLSSCVLQALCAVGST